MGENAARLRKLIVRTIRNSAFITLFATTLGVLLALYLNGLTETRSKRVRVDKAYSNIIEELERNKKSLLRSLRNDSTIIALEKIKVYDPSLEGEIVASAQTIDSIMEQIKVAEIVDSISLGNGIVKYKVNYKDLGFSISTLPEVAWEAAQMAAVTNEFDYACLIAIIESYDLQNLFEAEELKLLEFYVEEKYNQFYRVVAISRYLRLQLINQYEEAIINLKNCN